MQYKLLIISICCCVFTNTSTAELQLNVNSLKNFSTSTLISLPVPQHFDGDFNYLDEFSKISTKNISEIKHDNKILKSFPNIVSSVTVYEVQDDGSLSFLGNTVSAKNSIYEVIFDYTQTQSLALDNSTFALIGVSVRMVAKIKTKSAGINLASIEGLGIAANHKKVTGSLEVRAIGVVSEKISSQIPVTTDLSPASISNALQSVATIKSHIFDDGTTITPQFLAISSGIKDSASEAQNNINKVVNPKQQQQQMQH